MDANADRPAITTFSLTNGGTAEQMLPANGYRTALMIQPQTEAVTINFGSTAGVQATGTLQFDANPADGETIAINAVALTFLDTVVDPTTDIERGVSATATRDNLITFLNASATAGLALATYSATTVSSDPAVLITYDAGGTDGNAYALADSSAAAVLRSGATLTGGLNAGNGLDIAVDQIIFFSKGEYPSLMNEIYIVSATAAAKTVYLEGIQGA